MILLRISLKRIMPRLSHLERIETNAHELEKHEYFKVLNLQVNEIVMQIKILRKKKRHY